MTNYQKYMNICENISHYPTDSELIYKYGFTKGELFEIREKKYEDSNYVKLSIKNESGKPILYWKNEEILMDFQGSQNLIRNSVLGVFADFRDSEMLNGFIFSEIESSLAIEGVRSTKARIEKINQMSYDSLTNKNEIIVKNMLMGYEFVKINEITKENILELYKILSRKCLKEDEKLQEGKYYRHDEVHIVDGNQTIVDKGVDWKELPKLMDDLLDYMNEEKSYEEHLVASHVIHYYMVYLHPYFDYNGRMARALSFWYNIRNAPSLSLLLVSEAINNKTHKNGYYNAIANSRNAGNDITYFLEYMSRIVLEYSKIYINFYTVLREIKGQGNLINRSTEIALKYVLAIPKVGEGWFDWKDYRDFSNDDFSKTRYLKLLNTLAELGILYSKEFKKAKLFRLNEKTFDLYR